MLRYVFAAAVAAISASGVLLLTGEARANGKAAKKSSDWKILGKDKEVKAGTMYTLRNITDNNSVKYGERKWGINLVWDKSTTLNNIKFMRKGGGTGVLKFGDEVAVHVKGGGYLDHKSRTIGINLAWSTEPQYEFVLCGGKKGSPVKTGDAVGLFNTSAKDFVIYAERPAGINLRWFKDRDLAGSIWTSLRAEAAKQLAEQGMKALKELFEK